MSVPNDELEYILGHLNEKNKVAAKSFLWWLLEKQLDEEDDSLTPKVLQAIEQGRIEFQNGQTRSLEDLRRELEI